MPRFLIRLLPLLLAPAALLWAAPSAYAQGEGIEVVSSSVTSEFPEGIRFKLEARAENEIGQIAVRFRIGQQTSGLYDYMEFEKGRLVDGELFWRTNTVARYIPPGTFITYNFEIEDSTGARLETERREFIYHDARFEWEEVSEGPVTVAYHGPVKPRAEIILDAILQTLGHMGPLLGADTDESIRVTMYSNVKEMLEALPPGSATIRRELITEGQAYADVGTLLVLGGGRLARGTASHEVTHMLVHRAAVGVFRNVPAWLNEGLAEYGNIDPGFSYEVALEFAIATDRLLPITSIRALPGTAEEVIIFYGEARGIVRFMVAKFGPERMRQLMAALKDGKNMDNALREVYGLDRLGLENQWRASIGAPAYSPPEEGRSRPTPIPFPTVLPYSLTPQPQSATVGDVSPTPTPEPEPAKPQEPAPEKEKEEAADRGGGGICSAPRPGAPRTVDLATLTLLTGLVGLGLGRRLLR